MSNGLRKALDRSQLRGDRREPVELPSILDGDGKPGVVYLGPISAKVLILVQKRFAKVVTDADGNFDLSDQDLEFFSDIMAKVVVDEHGKRIFDDESAREFSDCEFAAFTTIIHAFMLKQAGGAAAGKAPSTPPTEEPSSASPSASPVS
jgi:hypothetical protein